MGIIGGTAVVTCGIAIVSAPLIIGAVGFGAGGVVAGSVAAAWQATIGNVVAGSLFATLQSVGVLGLSGGAVAAVGVGGGVVGAATATGVATMALATNNEVEKMV